MSETRAKPFVAWSWPGELKKLANMDADVDSSVHFVVAGNDSTIGVRVPVVVTPLLPDDPKPGETWLTPSGRTAEITGAIYWDGECGDYFVPTSKGDYLASGDLRRLPVMKTFRIRGAVRDTIDPRRSPSYTIEAESRDAAIAKLAKSLEEMP